MGMGVRVKVLVGCIVTKEDFFEVTHVPDVCGHKVDEGRPFCGECGRSTDLTNSVWNFKFPELEEEEETQGLDEGEADGLWDVWSEDHLTVMHDEFKPTVYYLGVILYDSGDLMEGRSTKSSTCWDIKASEDEALKMMARLGFAGRGVNYYYCPSVG